MDLGDAKTKAIQYIREYSNNGTIIGAADNADYTLSANTYANSAQIDLAKVKKIPASKQITQINIPNQLGNNQGYDLQKHFDADLTDTQAAGSKAYYFEVDRQATVYIEESINGVWTILKNIVIPSTVIEFTAYKGLITPSNTANMVRIRFSGLYLYGIRNRCLYAYTFPTDADVPDYKPYVKYTMPADFMELDEVTQITDPKIYDQMADYYWEGIRTFVVNSSYSGSFDIHYWKYPVAIDASTIDTYTFEIDPDVAELIPFYIGGHMMIEEKPNVAIQLLNEYELRKSRLSTDNVDGFNQITNLAGW